MKRLLNYIASIPTLILGIRNSFSVGLHFLLNRKSDTPVALHMKDGATLKVYTAMDVWTAKEVCLDGDYEKYGVRIEDGWTIVDVGAAFGDFSVSIAKRNPKSRIYAFEPFPKYFKLVKENIEANGLKNIRVCQTAVGSKNGGLILYIGGGEGVQNTTSSKSRIKDDGTIKVPSKTLESIFKEEKIKVCDYLKMDCEGAEYDIFFNMPDFVLRKIRHICMEYHDNITRYTGKDLSLFLRKKGFSVTRTQNPYRKEIGFIYAKRV